MRAMLEPAMFVGLGAVAFWCYLRYPRLRPRSLVLAALHVVVSFGAFALVPLALRLLLPAMPSPGEAPYAVLALLIPTLTYLLLSWVWLLARVLHELSGGPRGGHPVATDH
jgi:cell shape-determining protein MreD